MVISYDIGYSHSDHSVKGNKLGFYAEIMLKILKTVVTTCCIIPQTPLVLSFLGGLKDMSFVGIIQRSKWQLTYGLER